MKSKTVLVKFNEEALKHYAYKTFITDLAVGDCVLVNARGLYQLVQVTALEEDMTEEQKKAATAWIIDKIDIDRYNKAMETLKKEEVLRRKAAERFKQISEENLWKMAAKDDEQLASILKELEIV